MNTKDWSFNDCILEVESSQIVSYTNTICHGEIPIVPVPFTVVQDDTLSEVVGSVTDKVEAAAYSLWVSNGLFVHMQDPVINTERDMVSELWREEDQRQLAQMVKETEGLT